MKMKMAKKKVHALFYILKGVLLLMFIFIRLLMGIQLVEINILFGTII